MNRRGFFSMLAGAAGAALVPWRGLDEPLIVLPARTIYRGNQLLSMEMITQKALEVPEQELVFRTVRQYTINNDNNDPLPTGVYGSYVNVHRPPRYYSYSLAFADIPLA